MLYLYMSIRIISVRKNITAYRYVVAMPEKCKESEEFISVKLILGDGLKK